MGKRVYTKTNFDEVKNLSIVLTVIIFGIIVIIHEGGHFLAAKKCGVLVEEFAIGMGPKIFSKIKGETLYSVRLFPVGGFCRMADDDIGSNSSRGFNSVSIYKKMIIVLAGVIMNFLLAFFISAGLESFSVHSELNISKVEANSPAATAGIMPGDKIVGIDNSSVHIYDDLRFELMTLKGDRTTVSVERNGKNMDFKLEPIKTSEGNKLGVVLEVKSPLFGESIEGYERAGILDVLHSGFWEMVYMVKTTVYGITQMVTMQISVDEVAGPIGLTTFVGDVYQESVKISIWSVVYNIAYITALLSANLGVMNILPIPALDGGRFIFLILEWFRGKPIPPEKEGAVHIVGFFLLMAFGIFIAFNDIIKLM